LWGWWCLVWLFWFEGALCPCLGFKGEDDVVFLVEEEDVAVGKEFDDECVGGGVFGDVYFDDAEFVAFGLYYFGISVSVV